MENPELIINLSGISYNYSDGASIFDKLDFRFFRGERIGLLGPNGSGKTTLFHLIMGLLRPVSGTIEIFGLPAVCERDFIKVRERIGLLFQDADDQLFSPTVLEDVAFGPLNLGKSQEEAVAIARNTLKYLDLGEFEDRITYKLSGGEKRLVSLATVLSMEPEVLLLDEPTSGLDEKTKAKLTQALADLNLSYIIISHEIDFLYEMTEQILTIKEGKICSDRAAHVHQHVHVHPHGRYLHEHKT